MRRGGLIRCLLSVCTPTSQPIRASWSAYRPHGHGLGFNRNAMWGSRPGRARSTPAVRDYAEVAM